MAILEPCLVGDIDLDMAVEHMVVVGDKQAMGNPITEDIPVVGDNLIGEDILAVVKGSLITGGNLVEVGSLVEVGNLIMGIPKLALKVKVSINILLLKWK